MLHFIPDFEALTLEKYLIIADLHIGMELEPKGYRIPPQTRKMIEKTKFLLEKTKKKSLIVLGDLKHQIPGTPYREMYEVRKYTENIRDLANITLVKGNHDGGIESIIPECEVVPELRVGKYLLVHGHRNPRGVQGSEAPRIIMAHNHPIARFTDKLGGVVQEKAWLVSKDICMMPSFNDMIAGTPVEECRLGPIAKKLKPEETSVYLLDGTYLGIVSHIAEKSNKSQPPED
jgi:putative SbcD/Mre11-related phosphoesterase